jgi:hypothetical protein
VYAGGFGNEKLPHVLHTTEAVSLLMQNTVMQ